MYKVLIVDDEKMIRMGIKKVIPWPELGVGQVFTAGSAREALELLKENRPEIMITDIRMSGMSGLELIEAAKEILPALRVLVLTGYDSFEYARQSLRLKVQDFFLKPVEESDLSQAIREQVHVLEAEEAEAKSSMLVRRTRGSIWISCVWRRVCVTWYTAGERTAGLLQIFWNFTVLTVFSDFR